MSAVRTASWPLYAVPALIVLAFAGVTLAALQHAQITASLALQVAIGLSTLAAVLGAIGGLLLATARRNVMWILAVALSGTAFVALLALVLASLAD